jgi:hypothetical protein
MALVVIRTVGPAGGGRIRPRQAGGGRTGPVRSGQDQPEVQGDGVGVQAGPPMQARGQGGAPPRSADDRS